MTTVAKPYTYFGIGTAATTLPDGSGKTVLNEGYA